MIYDNLSSIQIHGGDLLILIRHQNEADEIVWSRQGSHYDQWEKAYYKLPSGYYRVVLEAKAGSGTEPLNVAVDDVEIGFCPSGKYEHANKISRFPMFRVHQMSPIQQSQLPQRPEPISVSDLICKNKRTRRLQQATI